MASILQRLADRLSRRLNSAVVIHDLATQQLIYSTQIDAIDESMRNRIPSRSTDPEVDAYFASFREPWPEWPVRVPAKQGIGVESSVYMVIQHQRELLGHLWVLDREHRVKDADFRLVLSAAKSAALFFRRQELISDLERRRERDLLRDLFSTSESQRERSTEDLIGSEFFPPNSPATVIVVQPVRPGNKLDQAVRSQIGKVLEGVRATLTRGYALAIVRHDHGLLVVSPLDPVVRTKGISEIAGELRTRLCASIEEVTDEQWLVFAGVGGEHELLHALTSYEQAHHAVRVAMVSPDLGLVTSWSDLGSYRILSQFSLEKIAPEALHPGVMELVRSDEDPALLQTLETYLDLACDAKATAAELFIHRATLYYRLKRISEVTGADLTSGDDRLAIHLSLKLGRLSGLFGPGAGVVA